ncbi:unnamed protein product [Acanthoscelides obtectus]|uniref:NADPH-dependent diflavin oxidoreductase 1 n=2 Tax=Acanthoscelides obtectus TaxID=200917 RepID=A0A9P0LTC5_ACAOB|nr:unnamed protein product [Acanthoscelides obtectus]CAK1686801.1 NADPH-dependent diflavin oxidoreductase 1 [Acanthoscelides obtectus]
MTFSNERLAILYGSQTGNAQDLAERIWRESKRFYFKAVLRALDEYNVLDLVNEKCVIFICSTTGQGEEPDNMKTFWKFLLRKSLPSGVLSNLRVAVFGLGDSSYTKFNFAAKRLYKRLLNLGATAIVELGLGDDQHDLGYDAAADPWMANVWKELLLLYPLPSGVQPLPKDYVFRPRWKVSATALDVDVNRQNSIYYCVKTGNEFDSTVLENKRLTDASHFQDVRLIRFNTDGKHYNPGDILALRPKNLQWIVDEFMDVLSSNGVDIPPDSVFTLQQNDPDVPIPDVLRYKVTFSQLCLEYFDLLSIPRRQTFQVLAQLTDSELEKEKCLEFTTAEGQEELFSYVNRPRRNIVEVLRDFPNATKNLTTDVLFEILPPIKPREFSIASSFKLSPNEIHILVAVVRFKTKLAKERVGLCSNFLADLKKHDRASVWINKGSFKFPSDLDTPVIMVGPGTGVATFRSYILERISEGTATKDNLILFYGCRYRNMDFLCGQDFEELAEAHKMTFVTAFSREQDEKVYVQHKIIEHKEIVWKALQKKAYVYVAGNSKNMPQSVREAFTEVCIDIGGMTKEKAVHFMDIMDKTGRYQTECWS